MEHQRTGREQAALRYLDARRVSCPSGPLAGLRVCSDDAAPLGTVEGVVIDAVRGLVAYLVLRSPGFLTSRRHLLSMAEGAVLQDGATLRVPTRSADLQLLPFQRDAIPSFAPGPPSHAPATRDAA